jgi:hypothetical protein
VEPWPHRPDGDPQLSEPRLLQLGDSPGYVLLVGDGHYDYNRVTTQTLPNLLPPYLAYVDPWWGEVPTDNLLRQRR